MRRLPLVLARRAWQLYRIKWFERTPLPLARRCLWRANALKPRVVGLTPYQVDEEGGFEGLDVSPQTGHGKKEELPKALASLVVLITSSYGRV